MSVALFSTCVILVPVVVLPLHEFVKTYLKIFFYLSFRQIAYLLFLFFVLPCIPDCVLVLLRFFFLISSCYLFWFFSLQLRSNWQHAVHSLLYILITQQVTLLMLPMWRIVPQGGWMVTTLYFTFMVHTGRTRRMYAVSMKASPNLCDMLLLNNCLFLNCMRLMHSVMMPHVIQHLRQTTTSAASHTIISVCLCVCLYVTGRLDACRCSLIRIGEQVLLFFPVCLWLPLLRSSVFWSVW